MDKLISAKDFIKYKLLGGTAHDVHSPFVFDLLNTVIRDETPFYIFDKIESLRASLHFNSTKIPVRDYGTGGESNQDRLLPVSFIVDNFVQGPRYAQLLFRLVNHFRPACILELGTSLGITTLYLATPSSSSRIITLEGCPSTASMAQSHFDFFEMKNIELHVGEFGSTLPKVLRREGKIDFIYFDGNHRKNPTLAYFNQTLPHAHEESVFVFDDIHWSREMKEAWNEIKVRPEVSLSIDLFQFGLVFFKTGIPKQDYTLKF